MRLNYIPNSANLLLRGNGLLYNGWAVKDSRNLANTGWHISTFSEWVDLRIYAGSGGPLKETGYTHWDSPNTESTNQYYFNAFGAGERDGLGNFVNIKQIARWWTSTDYDISLLNLFITYNTGLLSSDSNNSLQYGCSVRLVKDNSTWTAGDTYTGNDGKTYATIKIGNQVWLSENLKETLYRDGSSIPEVTVDATWAALTTGARCSYNNS